MCRGEGLGAGWDSAQVLGWERKLVEGVDWVKGKRRE